MTPIRYGRSLQVGRIYSGSKKVQWGRNLYIVEGRGLGMALRGLISFISPYIMKGVKSIGREVLEGGVKVMNNLDDNKSFKESVTEEFQTRSKKLGAEALGKMQEKLLTGNALRRKILQEEKSCGKGMKSRGIKRKRLTMKDPVIKGTVVRDIQRILGEKEFTKKRKKRRRAIEEPSVFD
jgi:hypothetical protein